MAKVIGIFGAAAILVTTTMTGTAYSDRGHDKRGTLTAQASMLKQGDRTDVTFTPIITTGETIGKKGYRFEAIPDGIALQRHGGHKVDVYVNHETSTVPFPFNPATPTEANGENDFDNSQLSKLTLDRASGGVLEASMEIKSREGFQRFCSSFLGTEAEGFDRDLLLLNEEAIEWVSKSQPSWPAAQGAAGARQSGVVVAYDIRNGKRRPIWGMGRLNHENSVALPGYDGIVTLSGDDTFLNNPAQSQVYAYLADDSKDLWNDKGDLWAFVSDTAGFDDYYDFVPGSTDSISGHFVKVPRDIATGRLNGTGRDLVAADKGYAAPTSADFAADSFGRPTDGPQWVLERWSDDNSAFQFVRIEDMAYDKRPGMGNVVYLADSGRGTAGAPQPGRSTNGRIWRMELDPDDPTKVLSLSIFRDGDDQAVKTVGEIHQPDNVETTARSLLVTEDPGSSQQFPVGSPDPAATEARLWRVSITDPASAEVVARVDQSADGGPTDVDGRAPGNLGAWESSGVVDASATFGPGAFLVTVQSHTLWVERAPGTDNNQDGLPDFTFKREGGQLVLVRIPGA